MNQLLEPCLNIAFRVLLLSPLFMICDKKKRIYIWLFILILFLNQFGLVLGMQFTKPLQLNWNWVGKIMSILVSIVFLIFLKRYIKTIPFTDYNISFKQRLHSKKAIIAALILIALPLIGNLFVGKVNFLAETLLFQATMPGIDEELSFRGIYLALLNNVFEKKYKFFNCRFGWGLIVVSILFGAVHSLNISLNYGLNFDYINFMVTGILGFCFGILAESSGSILLPTVVHNAFNMFGYLIRVLK